MTMVLMCGLSFAGKSTLAASLAEALPANLVSLDLINEERGLQGGQGIPLEEWAETNRIAHERGRELLSAGRHVVVDDTGSPRFIRDGWREIADQSGAPFMIVWVQISLELQRARVRANRQSRGRPDVTDAVLHDHRKGFEPPTNEEALVVDAEETRDAAQITALVQRIRCYGKP
jgi:predicted kinase